LRLRLAERGVRALQRELARALQHEVIVRQRLLFVAEAALDDVRIALVLRVVRERAVEARDAGGADRILGRGLEFLAGGDLVLRLRQLDLVARGWRRCWSCAFRRWTFSWLSPRAYLRTALINASNIWPAIAMICAFA
jgi:hypothetical protein